MNKLIAALLAVTTVTCFAADVAVYRTPDIVATITDEPCSDEVLNYWKQQNVVISPEEAKSLAEVRVSKFFATEVDFKACVLPQDGDGDYFIIDSKGRTGWLLGKNTQKLVKKDI